jgi:O-antigen/teichoic acid export membrane protein
MGDILAHTIMGESYAGHGEIMVVLACALLANSLGMTAGNGIWAMNHPAHNLSADVTSLVVTFGVATYLVPSLGALGAAWSAAIGHTCSALQRWLTFGRLVRLAQLRERENEPIATSQ